MNRSIPENQSSRTVVYYRADLWNYYKLTWEVDGPTFAFEHEARQYIAHTYGEPAHRIVRITWEVID
jgi:hypothetical protein